MALFVAQVETDEEATLALRGGADAALLRGRFVWPGQDARWTELVPVAEKGAMASEPRALAVVQDGIPDQAAVKGIRECGYVGLLLQRATPLLFAIEPADAARFVALCRAGGLDCGFAGRLEAPDMPRLLALDPDFLVIGQALRHEGSLDANALRLFRDLIPRAGAANPAASAPPARPDRIFVRDLVLPMAIGAYTGEVGRNQRVRFSIEAEVAPAGRPAQDLRDVVSYDLITDAVTQTVASGHIQLSETVAERIAARVLTHPRVLSVRVVVEKLDLGPGSVGVEIWRERA